MSISLITGPAIEPVTLADMKLQCGLPPSDDADHVKAQMVAQQLRRYIRGARALCENFTRRVFLTQTWMLQLDNWPRHELKYGWKGYPEIFLPKPPFQSLQFFTYVDTQGNLQNMIAPSTGFTEPGSDNPLNFTAPAYTCQVDPGSETQVARLTPPWAQPFPPIRMIPNNVAVTFKCGYGGPVAVTTSANSAVLTGEIWNPGDVGQAISIPGAGASGAVLATTIASVDATGQATLATAATLAVTKATAYAGAAVPEPILDAILLVGQFLYDGLPLTAELPPVAKYLLGPYVNRVS
jgi:hypothetical protein